MEIGIFIEAFREKVYLRLERAGWCILLRLVDVDGHAVEAGALLTIEKDTGVVSLSHHINPKILKELGWESTSDGALVADTHDEDC